MGGFRPPRIYAAGDVANAEKFTHSAYSYSAYATLNALSPIRLFNASKRQIPRCTSTFPEVAHIGLPYHQLPNGPFDCDHEPLSHNDRAKIHAAPPGFAKLYAPKCKSKIVAANAGELIATISLSMTPKRGLSQLARCQHHHIFYLAKAKQPPLILAILHKRMNLIKHLKDRLS